MNLDDIQNGSLCVIDTNILIFAEQGVSTQAQRLLWLISCDSDTIGSQSVRGGLIELDDRIRSEMEVVFWMGTGDDRWT